MINYEMLYFLYNYIHNTNKGKYIHVLYRYTRYIIAVYTQPPVTTCRHVNIENKSNLKLRGRQVYIIIMYIHSCFLWSKNSILATTKKIKYQLNNKRK